MQINDEIRDKIYTAVCNEIRKTEKAKVADVYSGIGIISNIVADCAEKVVGIEIVKEAIEGLPSIQNPSIEEIVRADSEARRYVRDAMKGGR